MATNPKSLSVKSMTCIVGFCLITGKWRQVSEGETHTRIRCFFPRGADRNTATSLWLILVYLYFAVPLAAQGRWRSPQEDTDNGRIFYDDHFDTYHNFAEGVSGPCRTAYTGGGFELDIIPPGNNCVFSLWGAGYFFGNVRLDVHAKITHGPLNLGYGMVFGEQAREILGAYYYVVNAEGKYALLREKGHGWDAIIPWTYNRNIKQGIGNENHLTAEISGRSINLYVNGKKLDSATVATNVRGYIGLRGDGKSVFRHVRVSEFYRPGGGELEHTFSVLSSATNDEPPFQNGSCAFGHSGDYFTVSVVTPDGGPCSGSTTTELKNVQVHVEGPPRPEHIFFETTARLLRGSDTGGYGLKFSLNYTGLETQYFFEISGNGSAAITSMQRGSWRRIMDWQEIDLINTGHDADNYLVVEVWGLIFYCYVNGKYVGSASIPTPDVATFGPVVDFAATTAGFKDVNFSLVFQ